MNDTEVEQTIRTYLPQVVHMSLGTCRGGKPWVCEVHFVFDDDLNLYFRSLIQPRHSQEIADNPSVAGNIVTQHFLHQKVRGVYYEGRAEQLSDIDTTHPVYQLFRDRLSLGPKIIEDASQAGGPKFYKITVSDYYLFDTYTSNPGQKYQLAWGSSKIVPAP